MHLILILLLIFHQPSLVAAAAFVVLDPQLPIHISILDVQLFHLSYAVSSGLFFVGLLCIRMRMLRRGASARDLRPMPFSEDNHTELLNRPSAWSALVDADSVPRPGCQLGL